MSTTPVIARVVIDVTRPGSCVGWVAMNDGETHPLLGSREGGRWELRAGDQDQFRGSARALEVAGKLVALECGAVSGKVETAYDYRSGGKVFEF